MTATLQIGSGAGAIRSQIDDQDVELLGDTALERIWTAGGELALSWDVALALRDALDDEAREAGLHSSLPAWISENDIVILGDLVAQAQLPKRTPLRLQLRASRTPGHPEFALRTRWRTRADRRVDPAPEVDGGLVRWGGEVRRLSAGQFRVLHAIDREGALGTDRERDFAAMSRIVGSVPNGDPGVIVDKALASNPVSVLNSVTPRLDPVEGGYQVVPQIDGLSARETDDYYFKTPGNALGRGSINKRTEQGVHRSVFSEEAAAGLRRCRDLNVLTPQQAAHALSHPEQVFGEHLDVDAYSERVVGHGPYVAQAIPSVRETESGDWWTWDVDVAVEPMDLEDDNVGSVPEGFSLKDDTLREHLKNAVEEAEAAGDRFVPNPRGPGFIEITQALRDALETAEQLVEASRDTEGKLNRPPREVLLVKENVLSLQFDRAVLAPQQRPAQLPSPPGLRPGISLRSYQAEGFAWLAGLYDRAGEAPWVGALLADDMGLGKTLQVLSFFAWARAHAGGGPHLVVGPVGLLDNWEQEATKFFGTALEPVHRVHGRDLPADPGVAARRLEAQQIVLVSYDALRRNEEVFARANWRTIVIDEAQKAKNPGSQIARVLRALKASFRIAVSGTPVENTLKELWTIFDWAAPGLLGTLRGFATEYLGPLKSADPEDKAVLAKRLHETIERVFTRRLKADMLPELPELHWHEERIPLGPSQEDAYAELVSRGGTRGSIGRLNALFAACAHPALGRGQPELPSPAEESFPRYERLCALLDVVRDRGEKAIVFANRRALHDWLAQQLWERYGVHVPMINGTTPPQRRTKLIDAFCSEPGFGVIVLAPRAAGVGLNITAANHVIHYTREWNPAVENQATDRAYRIGQERPVHVHAFIATSPNGTTVEERLDRLLRDKRELMRRFVVPMGSFEITASELEEDGGTATVRPARRDEPWLATIGDEGVRKVILHIATHGEATEADVERLLGSAREARRFARRFEQYAALVPFEMTIDGYGGGKAYRKVSGG